jgi:hypothetical protein
MQTRYKKKDKSMQQPLSNPRLYNGLDEGQAVEFEKWLVEHQSRLEQFAIVIRQKLHANAKLRRERGAYDKPAFSEFQADCNGYERALEEVLSYLKITKET